MWAYPQGTQSAPTALQIQIFKTEHKNPLRKDSAAGFLNANISWQRRDRR